MLHLQKKDVKENALNNIQVQIQLKGTCTMYIAEHGRVDLTDS